MGAVRLVVPAVALAVAFSVAPAPAGAGAGAGTAGPSSPPPLPAPAAATRPELPALPGQASTTAEETLRAVQQIFSGAGPGRAGARRAGPDLTLLLRDLRLRLDELSGADRTAAERFLARPDGAPAFPGEPLYGVGANPTNDCAVAPTPGSNVCVHYATATGDAPPATDANTNGLPDQVDLTRDVMNQVWQRIVVRGGYRAPLDDSSSPNNGPDGRLDVYLADIGDDGLYGYCASDDPNLVNYAVSAFCVLDDDYSAAQFPFNTPAGNLKVTAAHEFFHAVQFAYDAAEDTWLMEGTAAWVEDEIYDSVNDNRQYLRVGPLTDPWVPLDYFGTVGDRSYSPYASWIFWRYLSERLPSTGGTGLPLVVRQVFQRMGGASPTDPGLYSAQALTRTLTARNTTLPRLLTDFGAANRRPKASYEEGAAYATAPLYAKGTLNDTTQRVFFDNRPLHLSTNTVRIVPGRKLKARSWKLRVSVDMPKRSYGYAAAVTTFPKSGKVTTRHVALKANGDGSLAVPFSRRTVKAVEVTLTNASTRYTCWQNQVYSCQGLPKDDGRRVLGTVKAFR
jgi:hypothetical protein